MEPFQDYGFCSSPSGIGSLPGRCHMPVASVGFGTAGRLLCDTLPVEPALAGLVARSVWLP